MASRSQSPKWSPDGKYIAFVSDRSGPRRSLDLAIPKARTPKKITDLDNEKGAPIWTPDSKSLLYTAGGKKLYSYTVADGKTAVVTQQRHRPDRIGRGLARQQVGRRSRSRIARCARTSTSCRSAAAKSGTSPTTR